MSAEWLAPYSKGFVTMAALIVAIGVQNAFVLRQGVKRRSVFIAATICLLCDVALISLGTAGLGALLTASPLLSLLIAWAGAAFLLFYGLRSLHAAKQAKGLDLKSAEHVSRANIILTALAVSLLNPHALIDTIVLVGGLAARYQGIARIACAVGAVTASGVWFYGLAYGARWLAPILTKPKIWRVIDLVIGVMMLSLASGLAKDGLQLFNQVNP
jgi:L-lysine exporter family protein LysE/ArgO